MFFSDTAIDISTATQKKTATGIGNSTQLSCIVQSYPAVQSQHVNIYKDSSRITSGITVTAKTDETDVFVISLDFPSVERSDLGNYTVVLDMLDNRVGKVNITLILEEDGKFFYNCIFFIVFKYN